MDMVRGVAVLGILLININSFALPIEATHEFSDAGYHSEIDAWVYSLVSVLATGKFLSIFSLLFGAGVALMVDARRRRGEPAIGLHYRRMAVLACIGFLHGTLIWYGDILLPYAICGAVLYPLLFVSRRTLLWIAAVLWAVTLLLALGFGALMMLSESMPSEGGGETSSRLFENEAELMRGGLMSIIKVRLAHWLLLLVVAPFITLPWVMAMMVTGVLAKRHGWLTGQRPTRDYGLLLGGALVVGLPLASARVYLEMGSESESYYLISIAVNMIDAAVLGSAWIAVVMIIAKAGVLAWIRRAIAAVGRMALTNYLAQSVLCTMLFYGYGFGLFGTLSRSELLGVVGAVWLLQLVWSPWWLSRFQRGPMEAVWRRLTYPKPTPQQPASTSSIAPPGPMHSTSVKDQRED